MRPAVIVVADPDTLGARAAAAVADGLARAADARGSASLVLAGGRTPVRLYEHLATDQYDRVPWAALDIFWGDERYVPDDSADSNAHMVRRHLLARVPLAPRHVHPMSTAFANPQDAADAYTRTLGAHFGASHAPRFDVVLLGLGADGHTASLFPHSPALIDTRWVVPALAPSEPRQRLTLTPAVLLPARAIHVLVAGSDKSQALAAVTSGAADAQDYPAAVLAGAEGTVTWWADADAAARLPREPRSS